MNPIAEIAINGHRLKKYSGNVYLKDQTEFQIELQNPTQDVFKAMIELNGKPISIAGLVLNPGQHFYLDRFIDEQKKFLFETYNVSDTKAAKKAIQKNGLVRILFYQEKSKINYNQIFIDYNTYINKGPQLQPWDPWNPWRTGPYYQVSNISDQFCFFSATNSNLSENVSSDGSRKTQKSIETGRIESGRESDQKFQTVYKDFESFTAVTYTYHLLPISAKVYTAKDLRTYCTQCGTRLRKGNRFCGQCGTRA